MNELDLIRFNKLSEQYDKFKHLLENFGNRLALIEEIINTKVIKRITLDGQDNGTKTP